MKNHIFSVTIVIPNWNGRNLLEKHLPSVVVHKGKADIIVVDDGSDDDSVTFVRNAYPFITVVEKTPHEGFASAVNSGVAKAKSDIVILLNTDVKPEKGFIEPLIKHFSNPKVFAVGCMDKSLENGKTVLRGRGIGWWEKGLYVHKRGEVNESDTAWVSGGSGAFRKSIWNELGGMDERFNPCYWEDIDLCYRAVKKGYSILFEPKSIVRHFHEEGMIRSKYSINQIRQISQRNQFIFIWKHASCRQLMFGFIWIPFRVLKALLHKDASMVIGFLRAIPYFVPTLIKRVIKSAF